MIVSNPPYISALEFENLEPELRYYEPRIALTDDSDGLTFYKRIAEIAPNLLTKRGRMLVGELVLARTKLSKKSSDPQVWKCFEPLNDLAGIPRVIVAKLPASN